MSDAVVHTLFTDVVVDVNPGLVFALVALGFAAHTQSFPPVLKAPKAGPALRVVLA